MDYDPLNELLDSLTRSERQAKLTSLRRLAAPDRITRLIDHAAASPEVVSAACADSFAHPNGFDRIVLHKDADQGELRIHIWWQGAPNDEWVHNHRWDFHSVVLLGELRSQVFSESANGQLFQRYRSRLPPAGKSGEYTFEHTGPARLTVDFEGVFATGTAYWHRRQVFHRVLASRQLRSPLVTLIVRGPAHSDHSEVMAPSGADVPPTRSLRLFQATEIVDRLRALRSYF